MLKAPYDLPNVQIEETIQKDLWKHLSLKSPDIPRPDRYPLSSRQSKENIRCNTSLKFFSNKAPLGQDRSSCSETRQDPDYSEITKLKSYLNSKSDQLKQKERQLIKLEHELNSKILNFEEEKSKWCVQISLKLKHIERKQEEFDLEKENLNIKEEELNEKLKNIKENETKAKKMMKDAKKTMEKIQKSEKKLMIRERKILEQEERLEMKLEDLAGYERKIVSFEESLKNREEDLENIAGLIEEKKRDIEKTADLFEAINNQLKLEQTYLNSQRTLQVSQEKILAQEKSELRVLEKSVASMKDCKSLHDHSVVSAFLPYTERSNFRSPSFDSDTSTDSFLYSIRTPE